MAQDIELDININEEKNGIELKFDSRPEQEVLNRLKEMGFRWHSQKKIWYSGLSTERIEFANNLKTELSPQVSVEDVEKTEITQEEIDAILARGSGVSQGKMRIYEQFQKRMSSKENIDFLKNEYGIGGSYPALANSKIFENHSGKGIELEKKGINQIDNILLKWPDVEKRIKHLISQDKYLNNKEKDEYLNYLAEKQIKQQRADIAYKFQKIVREFNDYIRENDIKDKFLNGYVLGDCVSQFIQGNKITYALSKDNYIIPLMRNAMNAIIDEDTYLTQRCIEMLELLETDLAKELDIEPASASALMKEDIELLKGIERYNKMLEKSRIQIQAAQIDLDMMYNLKTISMDDATNRYTIKDEIIQGNILLKHIENGDLSILDLSEYSIKDRSANETLGSMIENAQIRQNVQNNISARQEFCREDGVEK